MGCQPNAPKKERFWRIYQTAVWRIRLLSDLALTEKALRQRVERRGVPCQWAGRKLVFDLRELDQWCATLPGTTLQEAMDRSAGAARGTALVRALRHFW